MSEQQEGSVSYVPIASDDGNDNKKGHHIRRFSDSALDASSWAPPSSPGGPTWMNAHMEQPNVAPPYTFPQQQQQQQQQQQPNNNNKTLQDQVLAGTLGLLRMAGGATLSTTGKLIQPPLHVTQHLLLPALWSALIEYLNQVTPLRVKDWFRIVHSSIHHIVTVIGNTARGRIFQSKVHAVGDGLVDFVSSDASRQAIMDGMAAWVKLAEALHTPETKVFLDQVSVLACRLVDAAASGRNKQLLCGITDALWAGLELLSDPSSTLAFAEVTAYLCFALEMENHHYNPASRQHAAQLRYARNAHQRQTYVDREMTQDANTTVEQVMLSSLGEQVDETRSLPSNVVLSDNWLENETTELQNEMDFRERAQGEIDLELLQERITKRAEGLQELRKERTQPKQSDAIDDVRAQLERQRTVHASNETTATQQPPSTAPSRNGGDIEEIIVTTVDEHDDDTEYVEEDIVVEKQTQAAATETTETESKKTTTDDGLQYQDNKETAAASAEPKDEDPVGDWLPKSEDDQPSTESLNGESAPNRFYRRLDEIMDKKRTEAVLNVLNQQSDGQQGLSWFPKAAAAAGAGNERGQDTIKNRIAAVRNAARSSQIGVGKELLELAKGKETRRTFSYVTILVGLIAMFWFAMGFYGCYAMVFGASRLGGTEKLLPPSARSQEIVVRIVREVVHVDAEGNEMETAQYYPPVVSPENIDEVAACVAKATK